MAEHASFFRGALSSLDQNEPPTRVDSSRSVARENRRDGDDERQKAHRGRVIVRSLRGSGVGRPLAGGPREVLL